MILFKFKEETNTRWVVKTKFWNAAIIFQIKDQSTDKWISTRKSYEIWISKYFRLGSDHFWYDGANCGFSLGWIHFAWCNQSCKKCLEEA
jgi:hypothetical protein